MHAELLAHLNFQDTFEGIVRVDENLSIPSLSKRLFFSI